MRVSTALEKRVAKKEPIYHQDLAQVIYEASIGLKSNNRLEVIQHLKKGFPVQAFDKLQKNSTSLQIPWLL